jgi:hypothetical protein
MFDSLPRPASFLAIAGLVATTTFGGPSRAETDRYEPGVLPVLAGDSDVGLQFGAFGQLARFRGGLRPYAWRMQLVAVASVNEGATGTELPYREARFRIDWPHAGIASLRLLADLSYLRTTNYGYYGLGNASHAERQWEGLSEGTDAYVRARHTYQFDAAALELSVCARQKLAQGWSQLFGTTLRHSVVRPYPGSLLARDRVGATEDRQLYGIEDETRLGLGLGVTYDSRDHETVPTAGQFHELSMHMFPGSDPYLAANLTLRGYVPLAGERLSVGGRLVVDALSRRAPLLELSRYGGLQGGQGPGGGRGVRGIPQGRLLGRTKLIGNVEARSLFLPFTIAGERFTVGAGAFFDFGRVWTGTFRAVRSLDGTGIGMHWGAGAGPRLRWGDSLLIRADIAYAPLGEELGAAPAIYVDFDQVL